MLAIGIMSGTSLDGIDVALCEISGVNETTRVDLIAFHTYKLPQSISNKIKKCSSNALIEPAMISSLNFELGYVFADAVSKLCEEAGVNSSELTFIASHGQTVYHIPQKTHEYQASTLQLGESAIIANLCQSPVISDFRTADMAMGGEGAPLVPFSEYTLYKDYTKNRGLQNIGGIGNLTVIPSYGGLDEVVAFDTGPGNMMIDEAVQHLFNKKYDSNGDIAASGQLIEPLVNELKKHPYLEKPIPKSTGREMFGTSYTLELLEKYRMFAKEDLVRTLTWFTAYSITVNYKRFVLSQTPLDEIIISGGGSHNKTIRAELSQLLPEVSILTQEEIGYNSDAKEAIAFVILGNQTWHQEPSNVPSATGASRAVIQGKITYV